MPMASWTGFKQKVNQQYTVWRQLKKISVCIQQNRSSDKMLNSTPSPIKLKNSSNSDLAKGEIEALEKRTGLFYPIAGDSAFKAYQASGILIDS